MDSKKPRRKKSPQVEVSCLQCTKIFKVRSSWVSYGYGKWCSRACFGLSTRGRVVSAEWAEKLGRVHRGVKKSPETRKKISNAKKGANSPLWRGGVSKINRTLRQNIMSTTEYTQWRTSVFEKDDYTCQECGARSQAGQKVVLNADHIEAFSVLMKKHGVDSVQSALICEDLWRISNGRTLCVFCHRKTPTYGSKVVDLGVIITP